MVKTFFKSLLELANEVSVLVCAERWLICEYKQTVSGRVGFFHKLFLIVIHEFCLLFLLFDV